MTIFEFLFIEGFFIILFSIAILVFFRSGLKCIKTVRTGQKVRGSITRIKSRGIEHKSHSVYVSYVYNGVEYNNVRLSCYYTGMYVGKKLNLYISPENIEEPVLRYEGHVSLLLSLIFTAISVFFLVEIFMEMF